VKSWASRPAAAALAVLIAVTVSAVSACGQEEERTHGFEGEFVHVTPDVLYQVQLTRLLNPRQRPDDTLLTGQPPAAKQDSYLAVFVRVLNNGDKPYSPPRDMSVVDTVGNKYLPLDATRSGFGLDFARPIEPDDEAPPLGSPAAEGPDRAAMVLFRVKLQSATDNLPLELEVPGQAEEPSRIELDV
jgi:hypothetical protein